MTESRLDARAMRDQFAGSGAFGLAPKISSQPSRYASVATFAGPLWPSCARDACGADDADDADDADVESAEDLDA